jgi:hypothetical protein
VVRERPAAAMLIRVTDPAFIDELIRFLSRIGFTVNECGVDTVGIDHGGEPRAVVLQQLQVYLQLWQATRSGVAAVVESENAEANTLRTQACFIGAEPVPV